MTDKLMEILSEIGLPFAYSHFAQGEEPEGPYICWLVSKNDPFAADGIVYQDYAEVHLELYSHSPVPKSAQKICSVLRQHGIFYEVTTTWIPDQGLYQVWFTFEMEVNDAQ